MKIFYITIVLLISVSFVHAESDLDAWNSIINSQTADEACSPASDDCGLAKEELKVLQNKNPLKEQRPAVKTAVKTKEKPALIKIEPDNSKDVKPEKKQGTSYSKIALAMSIGLLLGFVFRKWRKK